MENNRAVIYFFFLSTMGMIITFPLFVSAYSEDTTHPALTSETVKFFNINYPSLKFGDEEKELLMQGTKDEDQGTRALHHFYDPIYNRGITIAGIEWQKSKDWAVDTLAQASYSLNLISNPTERVLYGTVQEFFGGDTDYSWERAIYEYAWGDKERGLEALGHTLHLIQDASVPDHTRNDPHPPAFHFGSPFEKWTAQFGEENINVVSKLKSKKPVRFKDLESYFESMANYSNNNFFSKDSTPDNTDEFLIPKIKNKIPVRTSDGKIRIFAISFLENGGYKLVRIHKDSILAEESYFVNDIDHLILSDYWNLLSQQAVLHGAGVIKLFFDEVLKEKQTKTLYNKNKSLVQKFVDTVKSALSGDNKTPSPAESQSASVIFAESFEDTTASQAQGEPLSSPESFDTVSAIAEVASVTEAFAVETNIKKSEENTFALPVTLPSENKIINQTQTNSAILVPYQPGFGGGGGDNALASLQQKNIALPEETMPSPPPPSLPPLPPPPILVPAPIILSPASSPWNIATTTATFSGIASSTLIISNTFNNATTTTDANENWTLTVSGLSKGATTIQFVATNVNGLTATSAEKTISVDTTAPSISSFIVLECQYSLRTSACLSGGTTVNLSWSSTSTDISYFSLVKDGTQVGTTTATAGTITVSANGTYSMQIAAYDHVGNGATSTAQSVEVFSRPVVINEIAWAGTAAFTADEWIELYNRSAYTINLSSISIAALDGAPSIQLSGALASGSYYLIERTDDTTTSVSADLALAFSGEGGSGLSNSGEVLSLVHSLGGLATTTLDATPALASCGGAWCAGNNTTKQTMERVSAEVSGTLSSNWKSNNTFTKNGTDANGGAINGTPKSQNSVSLLSVGYYCSPSSSNFVEGGYYVPNGGLCAYLSEAMGSANRYGDVYRGVIASSTIVTGHFLANYTPKFENDGDYSWSTQGESFFTAIYKIRGFGYNDVTDFRNFFKTGANPPPHLDYGVINWHYGVE